MTKSYRTYKRARTNPWGHFSKLASVVVTGAGFVLFTMLLPSNSNQNTEARIFTQGLSIEIDRSSPAYAALEDTLSENTQSITDLADTREAQFTPATPIVYTKVVEPVAQRIVRENRREDSLLQQARSQRLQASQATTQQTTQTVINHPIQKISSEELAQFFSPLIKAQKLAPPASPQPARSYASLPQSEHSSHPTEAPPRIHTGAAPAGFVASQKPGVQQDPGAACLDNKNQSIHQLVISGPLQFSGGIAITSSSDRVVVYREDEEDKMEPGAVWLKDAKYEVFVDQPVGRLIGELRSGSGEVMGRGFVDLACLPEIDSHKYRLNQIAMTIGPVPHGISGQVTTAPIASQSNPKAKVLPVPNAHVQLGQLPYAALSHRDGKFNEDSLVEGSLVITHVDRPGHWGSLAFASVGSSVHLPMFSDQTMRALMTAATGSDHANTNTSFVWGRVTRNGFAVAGAKVDLMTSAQELKPVYFNALLLPDSNLKETSANGLYAFFPVEPGSHAVQATDGHGMTEPVLFPTDEQTVTQANLELGVTKQAKIRVFDAFKTDWPLAAEVVSAGRKHGAMIPREGQKNVAFTGGESLLVLDADAGPGYERIRILANKSQHNLDFPMIQSVWLDSIRGALRFNQAPGAGTIVGLIRGADTYRVSLEEESIAPTTKIVYFDQKGQVSRLGYGMRGGGFVILNMPSGFRTVLIQPSGSTKALATTVLVENRVTNVISKSF